MSSRDQQGDVTERWTDSWFSSASRWQWWQTRSAADWQRIWCERLFANVSSMNISWYSDVLVDGRLSAPIHRQTTARLAVTWRRQSGLTAAAAAAAAADEHQDDRVTSQQCSVHHRHAGTPASVSIVTAHTHNDDVIGLTVHDAVGACNPARTFTSAYMQGRIQEFNLGGRKSSGWRPPGDGRGKGASSSHWGGSYTEILLTFIIRKFHLCAFLCTVIQRRCNYGQCDIVSN